MKQCVSCGETKPLDDFYRDRRWLDSPRRPSCKACITARQKRPKQARFAVPKECSKCGIVKPPHEFFKEPRHADGLRADCKKCNVAGRAEKQRAWQRAHPEKLKENNRKYRAGRDRWSKEWRKRNPELVRLQDARKRAKRRSNSGLRDLTRAQWEAIKATYGNRCAYCGEKRKRLTMDHVVPLVKGGAHTASNVVPACRRCNSRKKEFAAPDFQPLLVH